MKMELAFDVDNQPQARPLNPKYVSNPLYPYAKKTLTPSSQLNL